MVDTQFKPGLEGVVAAQTRLSSVDGLKGDLVLGGYALEDQAPFATFEEVAYLLLHDEPPTAMQLAGFSGRLAAARALSTTTESLLRSAAESGVSLMSALVMAASTLAVGLPDDREGQAVVLLSKLPTAVTAHWRMS
jgi:citrate synthase